MHNLRDPDFRYRQGITLGRYHLTALDRLLSAGLAAGVRKHGVMKPMELPVFPLSTHNGQFAFRVDRKYVGTYRHASAKSECSREA
jgi:hypothetical protein